MVRNSLLLHVHLLIAPVTPDHVSVLSDCHLLSARCRPILTLAFIISSKFLQHHKKSCFQNVPLLFDNYFPDSKSADYLPYR